MEPYQVLLLDVWRAAGRHTEMATSSRTIAHLLTPWMPLAQLLVRRLDLERACLETVGLGLDRPLAQPLADRSDCAPAALQCLLTWCRRGAVLH